MTGQTYGADWSVKLFIRYGLAAVAIASFKTFIEKYKILQRKKMVDKQYYSDLTVMNHKAGAPDGQVGLIVSTSKGTGQKI